MNDYDVQVIADSVAPSGVRLTTVKATYPRFIHSEIMTHRVFSRNAASSRAIPTEKNIERVLQDPFIPQTFNARVKGMGVGEALDGEKQTAAREAWIAASRSAALAATKLNNIGIDKSRANRLLEPFIWMTTIISSTEWANYLALRQPDNEDPVPQLDFPAQPEFQIVARMFRDQIQASDPVELREGQWHLPMLSEEELATLCAAREQFDEYSDELADAVLFWKKVSAGRCARVSYDTQDNAEALHDSIRRAEALMKNGHFSPFEHVARPMTANDFDFVPATVDYAAGVVQYDTAFCGNFRGWVQFRKEIPNEADFGLATTTTEGAS